MQIPIAHPLIGQKEADTVLSVLASGMITLGPVTTNFENEFAAYCGVPNAVAVNNSTAAHCLGFLAAGVGLGSLGAIRDSVEDSLRS